nr:hypothetical protein [Tanacetum cinerariifolium]
EGFDQLEKPLLFRGRGEGSIPTPCKMVEGSLEATSLPSGLGNPKPINMMIEMANRSMQSPKGRPMLATAYAKIDVFRKKISLEVGTEQIVLSVNAGTRSLTVSPVCIINDYQVIDDLGDPEGLEEVLINEDINEDLETFLRKMAYYLTSMVKRIENFEIEDLWDDLDT